HNKFYNYHLASRSDPPKLMDSTGNMHKDSPISFHRSSDPRSAILTSHYHSISLRSRCSWSHCLALWR
ncbi:MAG: hypothetical protein WAO63_05345, partial [Bacteroidales bacterium]